MPPTHLSLGVGIKIRSQKVTEKSVTEKFIFFTRINHDVTGSLLNAHGRARLLLNIGRDTSYFAHERYE